MEKLDTSTFKSIHYKCIAKEYDKFTFYSDDQKTWYAKRFIHHLNIDPPFHKIVDIGAGSCKFAKILHNLLGLNKPILCVDPIPEFLELGSHYDEVEILCTDIMSFSKLDQNYDILILKEMIQHVLENDLLVLFTNLYHQLNPGGMMTILTHPSSQYFPWFEAAQEIWETQEYIPYESYERYLQEAGFKDVITHIENRRENMTKDDWYSHLRNRFASNLRELTDAQIENGIRSLEEGKMKEVEEIEINVPCYYIMASK